MFSLRNLDLGDYTNTMKKAMLMATVALTSLSFQHVAAAEEKTHDIETIYHVYNKEQFVGTISEEDKNILDQHLAIKLDQVKKQYPDKVLEVDKDVTYIEENVFHNDEAYTSALEALKNNVQIEAQATALVIDGKEVGYVATKEAADQLLRKFKLQYVTADELAQFENQTGDQEAPLTTSGSRLTSLTLSKNIEFVQSATIPTKIMDEQAALAFLNKGSYEVKNYTIQEGDVIENIASAYGLTTDELLKLNQGMTADSLLQVGQVIKVAAPRPVLEVTAQREIFKKQAIPFEHKIVESDDLNKGDSKLKQEGQVGEKATHYYVTQTNGKQVAQNILTDKVIKQPVAEVRIKGTKETPSTGSGQFAWPTVGGYISSEVGYRWGKMHKGIDIARPSDLTIKAADNGVVVSAGFNNGGYGNRVEIDHGNGMRTTYSHMSSISVSAGQTVSAGTKIGVMGSTGNSTGVHLHFELFINGRIANPLDYL
ncbi:M23 family metallopeptidase [Bacillus massiliigorillae]|uniref:M23 family metallopeptidase n=1 Tax=Bacillus massiliigorillae TaxID=1243664 RepID=UPI0003A894A8|nr:M23 family metallopeptidase [Bacillus massiliigorillae]